MATKSAIFLQDYDASSVVKGRGEASDQQANLLTLGQNSNRLHADLIYVIPRQWAHVEKVNIRGKIFNSLKVYAVGVNQDGIALMTTTISLNTLNRLHYGDARSDLKIEAIKNEKGLYRIPSGVNQTSVFSKGRLPSEIYLEDDKKYAHITRDFAFRVISRGDYLVPTFTQVPGTNEWDIDHYMEDGKEYIKFAPATLNTYEEVDSVPDVNPHFVCPGFVENYQKDLPSESVSK